MEVILLEIFNKLPQTPASERLKHNFYRLTSVLPVTSGTIFEHRSHTQDTIDISLRLSERDKSLQYFIQQLNDNPKYDVIYASHEWKIICSLLSTFSNIFNDCWLEFDDEHLQEKIPIPSILINPRQKQLDGNLISTGFNSPLLAATKLKGGSAIRRKNSVMPRCLQRG